MEEKKMRISALNFLHFARPLITLLRFNSQRYEYVIFSMLNTIQIYAHIAFTGSRENDRTQHKMRMKMRLQMNVAGAEIEKQNKQKSEDKKWKLQKHEFIKVE